MKNITLLTAILTILVCGQLALAADRPNVVIILTDDQGYGDLSCHGNPVIKTPNIDKLYEESIRFTDFHVDPTCAPTRAALMTGKYSHHVGVWHTIAGGNHLRATEVTMAEIFKANGYLTALFGKWHLGANYPYRPMDRGYDEWLGHGDGGTGTTDDYFFNDRVNDHYWHNGERVHREGYAPDVFFSAAINFIKSSAKKQKPFIIEVATYLPHDPHTIPDKAMIDKYEGKVSDYVAHFFAGIDRIDQNIGKLRQVLETTGQADNTIFIFMSDNGGTGGVKLYNAGMRGRKGLPYEGGHRVPFFVHWPDGKLNQGTDVNDLTAHIDVLPTLIELCALESKDEFTFDGRSFRSQLVDSKALPNRTLFVETQRNFIPEKWYWTSGMQGKWRLVNNKELYDISKDPGQQNNVIEQHPKIVEEIRNSYKTYWEKVSPGDREIKNVIVGHPADTEIFLSSSDWHLPKVPWNHSQVAAGSPLAGSWGIDVAKKGTYRFELRRWPREADTPIQGQPDFSAPADAWLSSGPVNKLIYGKVVKALPVTSISLEVGNFSATQKVNAEDTHISFDVKLKKGKTTVKGVMFDEHEHVLAGTYYVYITKV